MDKEGDYARALKLLNEALRLSPQNSEALQLQAICKAKVAEQLKEEETAYSAACREKTKEALQAFIRRYPNSPYRQQAENRLADYALWTQALQANTKAAYQSYLNTSKYLSFKDEAIEKITDIEADEEWNKIKGSDTVASYEAFISKYPNSRHVKEATWHRLVLRGEEAYAQNYRQTAYAYLAEADGISALTGIARAHFQDLKDERECESMLSSTDGNKIKAYLHRIGNTSKYYAQVSNHLATLLSKNLSVFSTDNDMDEALSYAMDASTRATVKQTIQIKKEERSRYNKRMRSNAHKRWWEDNFSWGFDGDIETNTMGDAGSALYYSAGLQFRFGGYQHLFNMTIGIKYRWFSQIQKIHYTYGDYSFSESRFATFGGALAVPLDLRFNIAKCSSRSRLFLGVGCEYGAKIFDKSNGYLENNYVAVYPQFGITSPHFDISIYWKTYKGGPFTKRARNDREEFNGNSHVGLQMAVLF